MPTLDVAIASNPKWEDLKFPFIGRNIDVSAGRISYNYFNGSVAYNANARYPEEPVSFFVQMPHEWKEGSAIRPHVHWYQRSSNIPNWLLAYQFNSKGSTRPALNTDYSNHTFATLQSNAFTYTGDILHQVSSFPEIDMSGFKLSDCIHFLIFRDTGNVSGLFAGVDPSGDPEHGLEFDIHYQIDSYGSTQELIK